MEKLLKILIGVGLLLIIEIGIISFLLLNNGKEPKRNDISYQPQINKRYELIRGDIPFFPSNQNAGTIYLFDNETGEVWMYTNVIGIGYRFIKAEKYFK